MIISAIYINVSVSSNPTPSEEEVLDNIRWPSAYTTRSSESQARQLNYLNIDKKLSVMKNPENDVINFWEELYDEYGQPPFNSY